MINLQKAPVKSQYQVQKCKLDVFLGKLSEPNNEKVSVFLPETLWIYQNRHLSKKVTRIFVAMVSNKYRDGRI